MKIYDISQKIFKCEVYLGDPSPKKNMLRLMENGDLYNLTEFSMCAHNGTHIDAPFHFINNGDTVDLIPLNSFVGMCYVASHCGILNKQDAINIISKAKTCGEEATKRILIKGDAIVSLEAAEVFEQEKILLLGNESQTVGPIDSPLEVHKLLLNSNIVLLEGIRLNDVSDGVYLLNAAPINLDGADGAPCRAILIDINMK